MNSLAPKTFAEAKERANRRLEARKARQGNSLSRVSKSSQRATEAPKRPSLRRKGRIKAKVDRKLVEWSRNVRERDGDQCQWPENRCLNRGTLHAHHKATRNRRPDLIYDEDNGTTLCFIHHQWVHDHPIEATTIGLLSDETYEKAAKESR